MAARRERYRGQQPAPATQNADDEAQSSTASANDPNTIDPNTADDEDGQQSAAYGEPDVTSDVVAVAAPEDADFDDDDDEVSVRPEDYLDEDEDEDGEQGGEQQQRSSDLYDAEIVDEKPQADDSAPGVQESDSWGDDEDEVVGPLSLADELGVQELGDIVFVDQGRLFSAAGRTAPIVELTDDDDLLIRPPEKPLSDDLPMESIEIREDDRGILLNELGERRKILGVKFRGSALYYLGDKAPEGTQRHYVGFFDGSGNICRLYLQGRCVTTDIVYKLRVRTHDGELGVFPELSDNPDAAAAPTPVPDASPE